MSETGQISTSVVCSPFSIPASAVPPVSPIASSCGQEVHNPRCPSYSHCCRCRRHRHHCHSYCRGDRDDYGHSSPHHRQHQHIWLSPEQLQDHYTKPVPSCERSQPLHAGVHGCCAEKGKKAMAKRTTAKTRETEGTTERWNKRARGP